MGSNQPARPARRHQQHSANSERLHYSGELDRLAGRDWQEHELLQLEHRKMATGLDQRHRRRPGIIRRISRRRYAVRGKDYEEGSIADTGEAHVLQPWPRRGSPALGTVD